MRSYATRAGRWPLALTLAAVAALGACADDPVTPKVQPPSKPTASVPPTGEFVEVTVANTSGDQDVGSIRWAAGQIHSAGGAIHFDPGLDGATIVLNGPIAPDGPMYVVGPAKGITLSGNDQHLVIAGEPENGAVSLKNVTITNGFAAFGPSGVDASSVYLENSTVRNNRAAGSAIRVVYGFDATNSTISQNNVGGPAISYTERAYVTFNNSTVAFNAPGPGIGLYGGVSPAYQLLVVLNNSILANNAQNCLSTSGLRYEGNNISSDWSCGAVGIGIGDPQLMPLANNGGPTWTHAIPLTSPARNSGAGCYPTVDQRYVPRDAKCDVGAFEFNDFTKVTLTIDAITKLDATGRALLTGTLTCTRNDTFRLALELHQDQKVGKDVVDVHAASDIPVNCTTTPQPWSAAMVLTDGQKFQTGAAKATAYTLQTPEWVTPASVANAVRIRK